jgi:hypothetical protein
MKILSFDIELYDDIVDGVEPDYKNIRPSIAAFCTNEHDTEYFYDIPYITVETAKRLVHRLQDYHNQGYSIFAWNGCDFDLKVLGYYSGLVDECADLALNSIDGMLLVTFRKGYFLGLDASLKGAGLESKRHTVKLNNGEELLTFSGKQAPEFWRNGEYEAVKYYLEGDVTGPLKLCDEIVKNHGIKWTSKTGKSMFVATELTPVKELFKLPVPNTSWMDSPKYREDFVRWIPDHILEKNGVNLYAQVR